MAKYNKVNQELIAELQAIVGKENILIEQEQLEKYKTDEEGNPKYHRLPEVVVLPGSTEEVAAIVKLANKYLVPITPRAAGTSLACGAVPVHNGIVLLTERLNKIIELNTDSLYMIVEAGVRTEDVQNAAGAKGLLYAGDPCSADSCLIGGNIATNAGGNKAVRYGTTRNQVYALEIVTPTGEIANIGARLNKNSTGFALEQLVMGAEGTLGIITKATLKLVPLAPYKMDLLAIFADLDKAINVVPKILKAGINPTSVEFMANDALQTSCEYLQVSAPHQEDGLYVIITVEAFKEEDLDNYVIALDELCTEAGAIEVLEADERIWRIRKNFAEAGRAKSLINMTEDAVVPLDKIVDLIQEAEKIRHRYGFELGTVAHIGDGNVHFMILKGDLPDEEWEEKLEKFHVDLYEYVYGVGGRLSGEHGIGWNKIKLLSTYADPVELDIMRKIKGALDPNGIMNPSKVFEM